MFLEVTLQNLEIRNYYPAPNLSVEVEGSNHFDPNSSPKPGLLDTEE